MRSRINGDEGAASAPSTRIGFIGAGRIGEPMVERLLAVGHPVVLYARRAEVRQRLAAAGAAVVDDPRDVAVAEVVVSCLYSDAQVLEVLPAVVRAMDTGTVLVSHTTGTPSTLARLAEANVAGRAAIVDAPFSGTAEAITQGRLTVYLGGDTAHVESARRVVSAYAEPVIATGARGSALRVKLLNNLLFAAISQVTLRGLEAGRAMGVAEQTLLDALAVSSGGSNAARYIAGRGGSGSYIAGVTPFLRKDVAACRDVAAELGLDLSALLDAAGDGPMDVACTPVEKGVRR
ncbi:NAD(P)-dependent oxidoreductase [Pseudonocardia kunmingensis]|uniref:3-hydroxyisobutyrate dehydrogenase-like beta-hydroxyacid dehydrogenase n=1 Tax=Pseudonocardia kunmingensis TaxID=630975 RepID=A0A543DPS1_9PSEU|nr:NAD(P)-binding domain-containing protein [Pseudonocardia kunmingensis]TQM11320.1 3-hydroxyisobutyrate dehydrogenase-like beta-hydroxyacid dehydrogenase [Pseudonocardia kunmingensis]